MKQLTFFPFGFWASSKGCPLRSCWCCSIVAFIITAPDVFLKPRIYMSFLQTVAPPLILGLGLTFVITAGEIDLSFPGRGRVFWVCVYLVLPRARPGV